MSCICVGEEASVAMPKDVAVKIGITLIQSALQLAKDGLLARDFS